MATAATGGRNTAATLLGPYHGSFPINSPGSYIGPTDVASVSFLVVLHSTTRPTCLERWASAANLSVRWLSGQQWATIVGAPRYIDRSFNVSIDDYRAANGRVIFQANHPAAVPSGVCGEVAGVGTIHSLIRPINLDVPQGGLSRVNLMTAYDAEPLVRQGYAGQGRTVVFIESDGFKSGDLSRFAVDQRLPGYNLTVVGTNPIKGDETPMDIETVHEIAPDAHLVFFNWAAALKNPNTATFADAFATSITAAAQHWPGAVFSISLGLCEEYFNRSDLTALNLAVASVEAQGSTVFASSGDSGGLDCTPVPAEAGQPPKNSFVGVEVPAALPAVTGTGGTSLSTDAQGNYIGEATWSEPLLAQGSGGGVSNVFARPSWQTGVGVGGQIDYHDGRQVPDVSADADPATGNFIIEGGKPSMGAGTSLAVPIWAGFTTLMDQYLVAHHDRPVGFFNPVLYRLADSPVPFPPFHDVTLGASDLFLATPGYDMVTGLGSPDVWNLTRDLAAGSR